MNKYSKSVLAITATTLIIGSLSAQAACTIYSDFNFTGKSGVVQDNHLLRFTVQGTREVNLMNRKVEMFRDPSWLKQISSVQTTDNCQAVFYTQESGHKQFKTIAQLPTAYNDAALGMFCECK